MKPLLGKLLGEATRLTKTEKLVDATAVIQRAIGQARGRSRQSSGAVGVAVLERPPALTLATPIPSSPRRAYRGADRVPAVVKAALTAKTSVARFQEEVYTSAAGSRNYKLFVPAGSGGRPLPLVVMLHGCAQTPDDFAAGTRMNELAQERGFLVLYPAQAPRSNSSKCWNWFQPADQRRGSGEPELLAGMTRHVVKAHGADPARVYIAGLSAGGSMADILGREYPDIFAAVGVHSGVPQGAAYDVASAFAAMHSGSPASSAMSSGLFGMPTSLATIVTPAARSLGTAGAPAIVFHGDRDSTVHPSNGEHVIGAVLAAGAGASGIVAVSARAPVAGREVTRTIHRRQGARAAEPSLAEHWVVHGAAHAWSGGSPAGSYTDAAGPDASREMLRFFEEHPLQRA